MIGAGPGGVAAADTAALLGKRVAIVERNSAVGGAAVNTGTIPSKTFREAVLALSAVSRSGSRPTAEQRLARVSEVVRREIEVQDNQLQRNDVAVIRGEAQFQDPHTLAVRSEAGSRTVRAATILVAVGTRAVTPPACSACLGSSVGRACD